MATHSVFLPGKFHGQRNLVGYTQSMELQGVRHDGVTEHMIEHRWQKGEERTPRVRLWDPEVSSCLVGAKVISIFKH